MHCIHAHIGSDRPSLKDLYDHVVPKVAVKWEDIGIQLLQSDHETTIGILKRDNPNNTVENCKLVLQKWLETTVDASWDQLIKALRHPGVQLVYVASQLEKNMIAHSMSFGYVVVVTQTQLGPLPNIIRYTST